jgi:hypothetical protein
MGSENKELPSLVSKAQESFKTPSPNNKKALSANGSPSFPTKVTEPMLLTSFPIPINWSFGQNKSSKIKQP